MFVCREVTEVQASSVTHHELVLKPHSINIRLQRIVATPTQRHVPPPLSCRVEGSIAGAAQEVIVSDLAAQRLWCELYLLSGLRVDVRQRGASLTRLQIV